jgi:exonuclease VII small subunit
MSFRLKEAVFRVKCREPGCPFFPEIIVKENIMGATEADVDSEAIKIARNMAFIKHDALYGRTHALANPEATKVTGSYVQLGTGPAAPAAAPAPAASVPTRSYRPGEIIIHKGESAVTVCEVVRGSAHNEKLPELVYMSGSTFGAAAIFRQKNRLADIVAGAEGATIAFYNLRELSKSNPSKARELYDEAMEDIFHVVQHLEEHADSLEKQVKKLQASLAAKKAAPKPAAKAKPKKAATKKKPAAKKKPPARKKQASKKAKKR